jgi:hypothetical protein
MTLAALNALMWMSVKLLTNLSISYDLQTVIGKSELLP